MSRAAAYFSKHTNRITLTATLPDESAAKLFAKQASQWADKHALSCAPKREGCAVTFRFARTAKSKNGPVIVSQQVAPATAPATETRRP